MPLKRIKIILMMFAAIMIIGIIGLMQLERLSLLDAVYLTVETLSTVGYGDIVPVTPAGKVFIIGLMIIGVGTTYYALSLFVGLAVEGQLKNLLGRRGMDRMIAAMKNHIIVCGAGRVGSNVVERLLHEGELFVVVESNQATYEQLLERKVPVIHGDSTQDEVLQAAGVAQAKGVISTLSHDADNVYVTLSAKSLNPNLMIVARAERPEAEEKLRRAGASTVIFPSVMGGRQMVSAMTRPVIMDFVENVFYNQELHLDIAEIAVADGSPLAGLSLAASGIKDKHNSIVVAIKRGAKLMTSPGAEAVIAGGDIMIVLGHRDSLAALVDQAAVTVRE
ncbi:MAG: potassium channel protein [Negativicutes bacterium]|nr:potassium channel protein [Negativicutes bacterium]